MSREYWMIYRGPGFLAVIWFGSYPLSRQQVVSRLLTGKGGGGQGFGSGSALIRVAGSESNRAKMLSLRGEGFSCSLGVLYGGALGISKLQFLIEKYKLFSAVNFFAVFGQQNPGSGSALNQCCSKFFLPWWRGWGRSQIIQRRESLVLYKWFVTLCSM